MAAQFPVVAEHDGKVLRLLLALHGRRILQKSHKLPPIEGVLGLVEMLPGDLNSGVLEGVQGFFEVAHRSAVGEHLLESVWVSILKGQALLDPFFEELRVADSGGDDFRCRDSALSDEIGVTSLIVCRPGQNEIPGALLRVARAGKTVGVGRGRRDRAGVIEG